MESESERARARQQREADGWRRRCGCLRTSDKLKRVLDCFPPPPPPTPEYPDGTNTCFHNERKFHKKKLASTCISAYCTNFHRCPKLQSPTPNKVVELALEPQEEPEPDKPLKKAQIKTWRVLRELVQLLQVSVSATALALYYLIYCYMYLVYCVLRSALYFHNADGAMKITLTVVTITSLVVALNLILKIENLIGIK